MNNPRNDNFNQYESEIRGTVACATKSVLNGLANATLEAEELFAEGISCAFEKMDKYDPTLGSVMSFLFKTVRSKVHRHAIKEIRGSGMMVAPCSFGDRASADLREELYISPHTNTFVDTHEDTTYREYDNALTIDVKKMLALFSSTDRAIIIDRFISDISLDEIASKYGMSRSSADRYCKQLRMVMKERMQDDNYSVY